MFEISTEKTRRWWTVPLAMLGESLVIAILISMPVIRLQVVPAPDLLSRMVLLAPPPLPRSR
jgi:hypothetical protein